MSKITESYNLQSPLKIKIEWCRQTDTPPITLSISALLLNKETNLVDKIEDFVFYGSSLNGNSKRITSNNGEVKCDSLDFKKGFGTGAKYEMTIDLNKINTDISKVRIIASIVSKTESLTEVPGFDKLTKAHFTLTDGANNTYRCDLEKEAESMSRSVDVAIVQRWDKNWRLLEELNYHLGGLNDVYNDDSYVSDLLSLKTPFSTIGNLFDIEQSYERQITIISDGGKGKKTRIDKFINKITKRYKKTSSPLDDPFFEQAFIINRPNSGKVEVEKPDFSFESKEKENPKSNDFSFGDIPLHNKKSSKISDKDFDFDSKKSSE